MTGLRGNDHGEQRRERLFGVLAVWILGLTACSGPQLSPQQAAYAELRSRQERALTEAEQAVLNLAPFSLRARYNPAACDCPPFEVRYEGSWHRVHLNGNEELLLELHRRALELGQVWVLGRPTEKTLAQASQQRFGVFQLDSLP